MLIFVFIFICIGHAFIVGRNRSNLVLTISFFTICLISMVYSAINNDFKIEIEEKQKIYSLQTRQAVLGEFFLGTGSLKTTPNYYFFTDAGNKGKKLGFVDATKTVIKETNDEVPQLITYYESKQPPTWFKFILPNGNEKTVKQYVLIIPLNSVKQVYEPNL